LPIRAKFTGAWGLSWFITVRSEPSGVAPVPVALFVYRRHEQLPRTLDCLRAGGVEQLYVFSDGPRDAPAADDVARVRELVASLDWIEPITIERAENVGLSASIRSGLDQVFETHEATIVVEDDVCVAPEFYDYARLALRHYEGVELIAGVTGLRYPFDRAAFEGYPYDVFLSPRFSSWGWATWRDSWDGFCFDAASLRARIGTAESFRPERAGADMPGMIEAAVVSGTLTGAWDVFCATSMLLKDQYFVTPAWNMVQNTGLAEGTHADRAPRWELRWEPDQRPRSNGIRFAPAEADEHVLREYRRFLARESAGRGALMHARVAAARWRTLRRLRRVRA
jgi:hypothetical protein